MQNRRTYGDGMKEGILLLVAVFLLATLLIFSGCSDWFHYTLTMEKEGEGAVEPPVGDHPHFFRNTTVHLSAFPRKGWEFSYWEGDVLEQFKAKTTIFLNGDKVVKAIFVEQEK